MSEPMSYIARCKCGCGGIVFAAVNDSRFKNDIAQEIADLIRDGYQIETMDTVEVRASNFGCQIRGKSAEQLQVFPEVSE